MAIAPKKAKPATVNETLRDRGIAHAVFLERMKAGEGERLLGVYRDEVLPDLVDRLTMRLARIEQRGIDIDEAGTQRLRDMLEVMQVTVDTWMTGFASDLADRSAEIGVAEIAWQDDLFKAVLPIAWDTVIPAAAFVRAAIVDSALDGVLLEDVVGRLSDGTKREMEKAIRIGIAEGESIERMVARLRRVSDYSVSSAEAIVRTAVGHASNVGRATYYLENQDLVKGVQWVATLDTSTCISCQSLDTKVFDIDKGARPPRHINCRCTTVPVLRSLRELGFNVNDFPPATRASMDGQVPQNTTYAEWLDRMPAGIQDEALGPTRGKLLRKGELSVRDFVNPQGELFLLEELKKREAGAWAKAGL